MTMPQGEQSRRSCSDDVRHLCTECIQKKVARNSCVNRIHGVIITEIHHYATYMVSIKLCNASFINVAPICMGIDSLFGFICCVHLEFDRSMGFG